MEKQLDLFQTTRVSIAVALQRAASNGRLFYTIRQVANLLGISGFRVYYLVYNYRLDALWVAGEYRIPFTAIIDYLQDCAAITRQYFDYLIYTDSRTAKGVLSFVRDPDNQPLPTLPEGMQVTPDMALAILGRQWPQKAQGSTEMNPIDWYGLEDLRLPWKAAVSSWAAILEISATALLSDSSWSEEEIICWPEMYDWMIEREVVNQPIPYRFVTPKKTSPEDKDQLAFDF